VNAILSNDSENDDEAWEFKYELYRKLPNELKTDQNRSAFMTQASKQNRFDLVDTEYDLACQNPSSEASIFNNYIQIAKLSKRMENATHAWKVAIDRGIANNITYDAYLDTARELNDLSAGEEGFNKASETEFAKSSTYEKFLLLLKKLNKIEKCIEVYKLAVANGIAGPEFYGIYISLIQEGHLTFPQVKDAFEQALQSTEPNAGLFNSYIQAAGTSMNYEEVKRAYQLALKKQTFDKYTFRNVIDAAKNSISSDRDRRWIDLATVAFQMAIVNEKLDAYSCGYYIDALVESGNEADESKALELFSNLEIYKQNCVQQENGIMVIDLHGFFYGQGYLKIKEFVAKNSHLSSFIIITGKGKTVDGAFLKFREYLLNKISKRMKGWNGEVVQNNLGRIKMRKRPHC
jgi:hypothetical protein